MHEASSLKIGTSGVRGIVGEAFTPQVVTAFAAAFGTYCGAGRVALGTDTRPSREMVTQAATAGLLSVGCTPVILGIVPTPALQHYVRETRAAGGICISASHNPREWNALKFFGADGTLLRPNQFAELTDLYHQGLYPRASAEAVPKVRKDRSAMKRHHEAVRRALDEAAVKAAAFRVAVDCCNGAASRAAPAFLEALGCTVTAVHTDPEAPFPRNPEPTEDVLQDLCRAVREAGAQAGFALDADGDRLALVDEEGRPLGEEYTLALVVDHILRRRRAGPVVVNMSTSRMVDDVAASHGMPVHRTPVGEVFVLEGMVRHGAAAGGEGNGGVIVPEINPCRDSFTGMALVLEAMAQEEAPLSALRARLPTYAMWKEKLRCRARFIAPCLRLIRYHFRDREQDLRDGVKVLWNDRWVHVRGSNTEPVIRVVAEAPDAEAARVLVEEVLEYLRPVCG